MTKIEKYIERQRIGNNIFKTKKCAILNSLINVTGQHENVIYFNGIAKIKFTKRDDED